MQKLCNLRSQTLNNNIMADIQEGTRLLLKHHKDKCVVAVNHEGEVLPLMDFPTGTPLEEMYAAIAESISANKNEVSND